MDKSRIAEWVLAKVSTQERAAEIVGDLLEQRPAPLAFWAAIVRILLAMHWRWLIAVPAAMFSVILAAKPYAETVVGPYNQVILAGPPRPAGYYGFEAFPPAMQVGSVLLVTGVCLCTVAALALFRYGVRSSLTHLSGLLAVLFTAGACCMALPHAIVAVPALLTLCRLVLWYAPWRRPLLSAVAGGATFLTCLWALGEVIGFCVTHLGSHQALVAFCALGGYVTCVVAEAWVLTTLHNRSTSLARHRAVSQTA